MQIDRKRCVLALALAAVMGLAAGALAQEKKDEAAAPAGAAARPEIGKPAPDFSALDCAGKKHTLADYKDKVVVLEWINQECPFSMRVQPICKALRDKYKDKGVVWIAIDSTNWRKPEENVQFAKDKGIDSPILMDNDGKVGKAYDAKTTPHIFVLNKGTLVYAGGLNDDQQGKKAAEEIRNYVDDALAAVVAGKAVPVAETKPWGCNVKYKK